MALGVSRFWVFDTSASLGHVIASSRVQQWLVLE